MINGIWYLVNGIFCLFGVGLSLEEFFAIYNQKLAGIGIEKFFSTWWYLLIGFSQVCGCILLTLYVVLRSNRHRVLNAILSYLALSVAMSVILVGSSVVLCFYYGIASSEEYADFKDIITHITEILISAATALYFIAIPVLSWLIYKHIAKGQIKG